MSKYIKTKKDVHLVEEETEEEYIVKIDLMNLVIPKDWVIKTSDNLEDLINRYIIVTKKSKVVYTKYNFKKMLDTNLIDKIKKGEKLVYGSIWIDGVVGEPLLYPVAKMNKEGVFELL